MTDLNFIFCCLIIIIVFVFTPKSIFSTDQESTPRILKTSKGNHYYCFFFRNTLEIIHNFNFSCVVFVLIILWNIPLNL